MARIDDVFEVLDPPPGGLAALRAAIADDAAPRWGWLVGGGVALGLAAAAALVVVWPGPARSPWLDRAVAAHDPGLAALGVGEAAAGLSLAEGAGSVAAVARVPVEVQGVVFYRVVADPR